MKVTELLLAELDREAVGIRKTLERAPEERNTETRHCAHCGRQWREWIEPDRVH